MSARAASPFSAAGVLALVLVGFSVFLAILYFLAQGDTGPQNNDNGAAHAAAKGLNGYSALVELARADGFSVAPSRKTSDLETAGVLVLAPPHDADPQEVRAIIEAREFLGPTLVILPKWITLSATQLLNVEDADALGEGWVSLTGTQVPFWTQEAQGPTALAVSAPPNEQAQPDLDPANASAAVDAAGEPGQRFITRGPIGGISGTLPSSAVHFAAPEQPFTALVVDAQDRVLALALDRHGMAGEPSDLEPNWVVFVIEPDLVNNWGLADRDRARTALSIVRIMGDGAYDRIVFDLTLNGFGGAMNLLTLAFQPPFLAATICLVLTLFVLGWRAFLRFGPPVANPRQTAFGKASLVTNGADLIVRARRLALLAEPYIALSERRSKALAEPSRAALFETQADALRRATKPIDIVRAARALYHHTKDT